MSDNQDYLTWFKDLDARLAKCRGVHSLISSNVCEPLDMLEGLIRENAAELRRLQKHNNDWGHPVLKERIAARYGVGPGNVLLTNGCTNATYLAVVSHVRPGDTFICEAPAYQPMWQSAAFVGAGIKWLKRRPPDYRVDPVELSRLVDGRTAMVSLTNLHNPSGALLRKGELREISAAVRRRNRRTRILVDEVFRDFVPEKPACTLDPMFISTGSLSKVYGLSHLECGWVMADKATIGRVWPYFAMSDGNGSRYLESLSAVVFEHLDEYLGRARELAARNRRALCRTMEPLLLEGLLEVKIPEHGCIWFPNLGGVGDAGPFCDHAARRHRVHVVPGKFFGDRSRFRVGFGGDAGRFSSAVRHLSEAVVSYRKRK
jgi:aspartate/methionine/tyrosine aminotransferase